MKAYKAALSILFLSNQMSFFPAVSAFTLPTTPKLMYRGARDFSRMNNLFFDISLHLLRPSSKYQLKSRCFSSLKSTSEDTQIPLSSIKINPNKDIVPPKLPTLSSLEGIIFDMDGTLLHPCIDFATMRSRIYEIANQDTSILQNREIPQPITSGCVLEYYEKLSKDGQKQAKVVFDEIEAEAIQNMRFMEDMAELMKFLDDHGIRRAVLTRNVEKSLIAMQDKLWNEEGVPPFFPAVARDTYTDTLYVRETGQVSIDDTETNEKGKRRPLIPKPDPDSIFHICQQWQCDSKNVIMVGDSAADDIRCANRASCASVLLQYKGEDWDNDSGNSVDAVQSEMEPSIIIQKLGDLQRILEMIEES